MNLSEKASEILWVAVNAKAPGAQRMIHKVKNDLGPGLIIGGGEKLIDCLQPDRDEWIDALEELGRNDLVEEVEENQFRVTQKGVQEASRQS